MEKDINRLMNIALFKDIPAGKISTIMRILRKVTCCENDIIMKEGESGDTMYIILEGTVEVAKSLIIGDIDDDDVTRSKVFTRLEGKHHAVFGEIALLEDLIRTATIKAVTNCVLYEIKKEDFLKLAEEDYEVGYRILLNLARMVSARLRKADEETVKLTTAMSIILQES